MLQTKLNRKREIQNFYIRAPIICHSVTSAKMLATVNFNAVELKRAAAWSHCCLACLVSVCASFASYYFLCFFMFIAARRESKDEATTGSRGGGKRREGIHNFN